VSTLLILAEPCPTGGAQDRASQVQTLIRAKGFLRTELGQRLGLRHVPELVFKVDEAAERGQRIETLLKDINVKLPQEGSPESEE
jgi:ribosome-binding factor A